MGWGEPHRPLNVGGHCCVCSGVCYHLASAASFCGRHAPPQAFPVVYIPVAPAAVPMVVTPTNTTTTNPTEQPPTRADLVRELAGALGIEIPGHVTAEQAWPALLDAVRASDAGEAVASFPPPPADGT